MTTLVRPTRTRLGANLFAIPLGVCGVAQCWTMADQVSAIPSWPGNVFWVLAAALWLALLLRYTLQLQRSDVAG